MFGCQWTGRCHQQHQCPFTMALSMGFLSRPGMVVHYRRPSTFRPPLSVSEDEGDVDSNSEPESEPEPFGRMGEDDLVSFIFALHRGDGNEVYRILKPVADQYDGLDTRSATALADSIQREMDKILTVLRESELTSSEKE